MFEAAELGQKISKELYKKEEPKLRQELLNAPRPHAHGLANRRG